MKNNLRALRQKEGLAIMGLVAKSGVSSNTVTAIEKWNYIPRDATKLKIANALRVPVSKIWPSVHTTASR